MGITIWLLGLISIVALLLAGFAWRRKIKRNDSAELLLFLAGLSLMLGLFSYVLNAYNAAKAGIVYGNSFITVITTVTDSSDRIFEISQTFANGAQILMATIVVSSICAILWHMLNHLKLKE